jgi:Carboxypeptidase regulatory-like domain/TonB-dependent Receptor Plug Domain
MATGTKSPFWLSAEFVLGSVAALVAVALLLSSPVTVTAQERSGNIAGIVQDQSGGVLPGVVVTLTNKESNRTVSTKTDTGGTYIARELEPGRYTVKFEFTGFANAVVQDVILLLGKTIEVNTTMQIGAVEQVVEVSSGATLIDTISTAVSHNVTAEEFDRMPKARSFQDVALTSPSVNSGKIEGGIQVNGSSAAENNFTIDGLSVTGVINGDSRQDAVYEFLQEVQVKTSGIEAEYGGALGGVISAVTKSGGNQFHGEAHWYNYGSNLSTGPTTRLLTNPSDEISTTYFQDSKIKDHNNEFGGSVGGPILKDKLYFFTSITPNWRRQEANIKFQDGPSTFNSDRNSISMFNKLSWDPVNRIRTNFSWLYTTQKRTGLLPAFTGYCADCNLNTSANYETSRTQGWYLPKNSYSGSMDVTLSSSSLISVRGGYFWDNYIDSNPPAKHQTRYNVSGIGLPFEIPSALQQPNNYFDVPLTEVSYFDITSRGFYMADYSKTFRFGGTHNLKGGGGFQKIVNNANTGYQGGGYNVAIYWDRSYKSLATGLTDRGQYGYYRVRTIGTQGSASSGIGHMYIQDQWQIHPRLTLSLGIRTERETVPSYNRDLQDVAIKFGWADKMAPRLGASFDLFGNGNTKIFGSWGRLFDWTKFELVRGSFGGDVWKEWWYSLDTLDIYSLGLNNLQGRNLWSPVPGSFQDHRSPLDENTLDPNLKPIFVDNMVFGVEHQLNPQLVVSAHYVRNRLSRTIEDIGRLVDGNEVYTIGNPGEGRFVMEDNHYGATPDYQMPRPKRNYDALELSLNRRFSSSWFLGGNYTYSKLYGNYAGLSSTDEVVQGGLPNQSWTVSQSPFTATARPGGNANRDYDSDEVMFDSHANFLMGRLETDRPHVVKLYGSYKLKWGTEVGARFYGGSGTPITTRVENLSQIPIMVNGRADAGRLPFLNTTDFLVSHEVKLGETKRLRFEFNAVNLFNQKTARYQQNIVTRYRDSSSAMDMSNVNLLKGYDWRTLLAETTYAQDKTRSSDPNSLDPNKNWAVDPTYGKYDLFNDGFAGRIMVKFIF